MAQTPEQIAQAWAAGMSNSRQKMQDGINSVTVAPGQAAARQKGAYVAGVQASQDKWATNVSRVSLSEWQQAMVGKGLDRIAGGATAAQPKVAQFMTKLIPYIAQVKGTLPPRGGLDANITRMTQFVRGMSQFKN